MKNMSYRLKNDDEILADLARKLDLVRRFKKIRDVDLVARGIVKGILEAGKDPAETVAAFRIPGAWEEEGFKILSKYGVPYLGRSTSIDDAAQMAVENSK